MQENHRPDMHKTQRTFMAWMIPAILMLSVPVLTMGSPGIAIIEPWAWGGNFLPLKGALSVARLPDGRVLIAGKENLTLDPLVRSFRADGVLDQTYGVNGTARTRGFRIGAFAVTSSGTVYVCGGTYTGVLC